MDEQGVKLLGRFHPQSQPGYRLGHQKNGAQRKEQDPLPPGLDAPGDRYAQERAVKEYQPIVDYAKNIHKLHGPAVPLPSKSSAI